MQFIKETPIAAPPERVFAFHEAPGALRELTPPWEHAEIVGGGGSLRPGARVVLVTRLGPFRLRWVAVHTEYDPPHLFADRQETGPFARWYHRHRFLDDGRGGTLLRDEIEYELPWGWFGRRLAGRFVERRLERLFDYRHEITQRRFAGGGAGRSGTDR
jgi:ligand-binding SRPBCC domain-containing protein